MSLWIAKQECALQKKVRPSDMVYERLKEHDRSLGWVQTTLYEQVNTLVRVQEAKKQTYLKRNNLRVEDGDNLVWQDCDPDVCLLEEATLAIHRAIEYVRVIRARFCVTSKPKPMELCVIRDKDTGMLLKDDHGRPRLFETKQLAENFTAGFKTEVVALREVED